MPRKRSGKKRVLIFSASIGGPHHSVAEALYRYYRAHHAETVEARIIDFLETFAPSLNVLARFAYQQQAPFFPHTTSELSELVQCEPDNPIVHELVSGAMARLERALEDARPDAVVSTFPVAGAATSEVSRSHGVFSATVLPSYGAQSIWLHPHTDFYFVASKEMREELVVRGIPWDRIGVSGVPVAEKFAEKLERTESRTALSLADRFTASIVSGSTSLDARDLAATLARNGIQVAVYVGGDTRTTPRLEALSARENLVNVYREPADARRMLSAGDVTVCAAGGSTVPESIACGVPLVVCAPVPGQELHDVDFLVNCGAVLSARDVYDAAEKVRYLSSHPDRLGQMALDAGLLGKANATQWVCERVLAALR